MSAASNPLGVATIVPAGPAQAGKVGTWTITLTVGSAGIATGGGFRIMPPVTVTGEHYNLVRWQLNTVTAAGPEDAELRAAIVTLNSGRYDGAFAAIVEVENLGRALVAGETVAVELKHAVASRFAMLDARFEIEVDCTGDRRYSCVEHDLPRGQIQEIAASCRLPDAPGIDVVPGPRVSLRAVLSRSCTIGGTGRLLLSARDACQNPAEALTGQLFICDMDGTPAGRGTYSLEKSDNGTTLVDGLALPSTGALRLRAKLLEHPIECLSSPCASDFPLNVYFGDMHCHHNLARDPGGAAALYNYARNVAGLDFTAMTDYDRHKLACREVTRRAYEPGRFVPLFAEEWSDRQSADHRNVYYRGDPGNTACRAGDSMALFEQFAGQDVLVIPHTTNIDCLVGWKHTDWSKHDPALQRLLEICQIRGDCEVEGPISSQPKGGHGGSARTALARGLHLGFVGGSDTHRGTPGGPGHELHPLVESTGPAFWGTTAVLAQQLTREAVFDALRERRCYATSGARILLWFELNGQPMGSETQGGGPINMRVRFHAEAPVTELAMIRNGSIWQQRQPNALDGGWEAVDDTAPPGTSYYYVRVTQSDGHRAWSSPIWVD